MRMNLKSLIKKEKMNLKILLLTLFFLLSCTSSSKIEEKKESNLISPKILRVTYDVTWEPKDFFSIKTSGNIHGSGNTYLIEYLENPLGIKWLRISSTNQENKHDFPYLMRDNTESLKVFYFPWQKNRISLLINQKNPPNGILQCRWEGVYKGYLIIIESALQKSEHISQVNFAESIHNYITSSLSLY